MGSLFKPKIEAGLPALPPAANPATFASAYSRILGGQAQRKMKKPTAKDAGFGDDGTPNADQSLGKSFTTATPSLLG